jgi:hypothetical protein
MQSGNALIFVYNCDRGNLSLLKDYSQKSSADKAPPCNLLSLIWSPVGIKKSWKRFIQDLGIPARFLHRDEYEEEFGALLTPLPAVFLHSQKTRTLFISADELNQVRSTDDLILLVTRQMALLP